MHTAKTLTVALMVACLTMWSGLAMAASTAPEAAKAPAASPAPAAPAEKGAQEAKVAPAEKARSVEEKGEKEIGPDRTVRGTIASIDMGTKTITVDVMHGKAKQTVGVEVPESAKITLGKTAKSLADLKVGERVRMTYDRLPDKLVADNIHILKAGPMAKVTGSKKQS